MISLCDYTVGIIATDELVRKVLPHIIHILGQGRILLFTDLYEAMRSFKKIEGSKILIADEPSHLRHLEIYQEALSEIFLFTLVDGDVVRHCTINECLDAMNDLKERVLSSLANENKEDVCSPFHLSQEESVKKKGKKSFVEESSYIFKHPNPPIDILTIYKIAKPVTMRGVINTLKAVLPEQVVRTDTVSLTYTLLENNLKERLKKYEVTTAHPLEQTVIE